MQMPWFDDAQRTGVLIELKCNMIKWSWQSCTCNGYNRFMRHINMG